MSDYETKHDQCRESLKSQWLEHTSHGKLYQILEDYDCDQYQSRYSQVRSRLLCRRADYIESHWDEEWDALVDAEEEAADPYGYRGLRRSDFL